MKRVNSTRIHSIHYEPTTKTCLVRFHNGKLYEYHNMTEQAYKAFEDAKSHGKHLEHHIIGKYPHRKV